MILKNGMIFQPDGTFIVGDMEFDETIRTIGQIDKPADINATNKAVIAAQRAAEAALPATGTAADSDKWGGYRISVVASLPSSPSSTTIYFVTG